MTHNDNIYESLIDYKEPVDYLEPEENINEYREASLQFIRILTLAVSYILDSNDPKGASYGVAFALGLTSVINGDSMREVGRKLNLSSGTISAHSKRFRQMAGLPTSLLQRDLDNADKCRETRKKQLL